MNTKCLLACIAALAAWNTVHAAGVHEIANAPSLMSSNYKARPLKPGNLRPNATEVLSAYPDANVLLVGNNGTPFAVRGHFGKYADSARQLDVNGLAPFMPTLAAFFGLSVDDLIFLSKADDPIGMAHFAFQVKLNGLDVVGASVLVHVAKDGEIVGASATVPDEIRIPGARPKTNRATAHTKLNAHIGGRLEADAEGRLVYFLPSQNQPLFLAWEIPFAPDGASDLPLYTGYVDAVTGTVVEIRDKVQRAKDRSIRDLNGGVGYDGSFFYIPVSVARSEGGGLVSAAAVNHGYDRSGSVYDYFDSAHHYDGPDGIGGTINVVVNSLFDVGNGITGDGALFTGQLSEGNKYLYFGTGTSTTPNLSANFANAIDIVGHEYMHWILYDRSIGPLLPLNATNETGAISEGIADMFGAMTENYTNGFSSNVWLIGEIRGTPYRSMADPAAYSATDYYPNYNSGIGIHRNSGIAALAFKLACVGGTHPRPSGKPPVTVPALGISTAEQVFFRAVTFYLPTGSGFPALKAAAYSAAFDIDQTTAAKVSLAFDAVGVPYGTGNLRAINISTRAWVGTGSEQMIAGFVMSGGSTAKNMLIRAVGPTLANFGLSGLLSDPYLDLNGIATNDNWWQASNASAIASTASAVGAFPLNSSSNDAAMLQSLNSGAYTALVSGASPGTGVGLVEVYDPDTSNSLRLVNISTRAKVTTTDPVIAGFVVTGNTGKKLLIRAVGPELANSPFNLSGVLSNPTLTLYLGQDVIYQNDNWGQAWNLSALTSATSTVGAFPLTSGSADSAMLVELPPGAYTAIVGGGSGITLIEVYEAQ